MKHWLVVIKDKERYLEPDIGVAIVVGDESAAHAAGAKMLEALALRAGRGRCAYRCTEIEPGKFYRTSVWFMPPPRTE